MMNSELNGTIECQESQKPFQGWNLLCATWFWVMLDENAGGRLCRFDVWNVHSDEMECMEYLPTTR